jgi:hemerythrin superfamily protein
VNAIDLLKEDHKVVSALFEKVRSTPDGSHRAIFKKIKAELDTHAHIEEKVFYPRLKKDGKKDLVDITLEGIEEHRQVKMFLKEMAGMGRGGREFEAKLQVLMEDVDHHVKEEEGEMFSMVEDQFSEEQLERLGRSLENRKIKYLEANPDVKKDLANRDALRKSGVLGTIYKTAVAAVGGLLSGDGGKTSNGRSNGKAKNSSGNGSKKTASGSGAAKSSKKTAAKKTSRRQTSAAR